MTNLDAMEHLEITLKRLNAGDLSARVPLQDPSSPLYAVAEEINQLAIKLETESIARKLDQGNILLHVFDNVPIDIAIFDKQFRYIFLNKSAVKDEALRKWMIGKNDYEYCEYRGIDAATAQKRNDLYLQVLNGKKLVSMREDSTTVMGQPYASLRTLSPVFDSDGNLELMIGCGIEITSLALTENELRLKNADLDKTNQELDHFVYRTSHEMRGPIASILGLLNLAEAEEKSPSMARYLSLLDGSVLKLDTFIREIVDYSINARREVEIKRIDWVKVVESAFEVHAHLDPVRSVKLRLDCNEADRFVGDEVRIGMLISHILSNSIKYCDLEKPECWVSVSISRDGDQARIRIADNGKGIPKAQQTKVFGMFFRATHDAFGSGLGLYIVAEVLAKLQGTVSLESEEGVGTVVTLLVPGKAVSLHSQF